MCQTFGINYRNAKKGAEQYNLRCAYRPSSFLSPSILPRACSQATVPQNRLLKSGKRPHFWNVQCRNTNETLFVLFQVCQKYQEKIRMVFLLRRRSEGSVLYFHIFQYLDYLTLPMPTGRGGEGELSQPPRVFRE